MAKYILHGRFDKHMIFSPGLCGHFALGTLSKTYLQDAVFEIHDFRKKSPQITTTKNVKSALYEDTAQSTIAL